MNVKTGVRNVGLCAGALALAVAAGSAVQAGEQPGGHLVITEVADDFVLGKIWRFCRNQHLTSLDDTMTADFPKRFGYNMISFKGRHFQKEMMLQSIRWYLAYSLSYRDIEEIMKERGFEVDHSTIQRELSEINISISLREIGYLGQRFIVYLALLHEQSQAKLKQLMEVRGGYILHLDGTCEGDSPHLMSSMDGLSKIVLSNIKIPTENAGQLIPFLRQIKQSYGTPIALVHDMGVAILNAVKEVFPGIPDYICHFHFLKDMGKDLFGHDYHTIRRHLKTHRIRSYLRKIVKGLKKAIDANPDSLQCLHRYLEGKTLLDPQTPLTPLVKAYLLICWILEARNESHGFGFPFDRPHLDFYLRLQEDD